MIVLLSADFFHDHFFILFLRKHSIRVANGLDPDQDRQFIGPDHGPNCLHRLSGDDIKLASKEKQASKEKIKAIT